MIEVEIKAISSEKAKNKIKANGVFLGTEKQKDIYLNHPDRDFSKTDEALRLREVENKVFLTYKGPKIDEKTKSREEVEEQIEDLDKSIKIFESLGFEKAGVVHKDRELYELHGYKISIDKVEGLGEFIELEREVKKPSDEVISETISFLKQLGVKEEDFERRSYLELLLNK